MKKTAIILSAIALPFVAFAQGEIKYEKNIYPLHMSPNGKWIGSSAGDASIYNVETGENVYYNECFMGLGSCVANNGMAVGESADVAVIMYNGATIYPETLATGFCDINAITPDATLITGTIANPERSAVSFVPFVATVDENGNVGEPTYLPYPDKDFFGVPPQFATAVSMSQDGKTVVGMIQDWRGMYSYPIYYTQDASGNWSYTLPTESLFNPTHIDLPQNPWRNEPPFPEPENFMTGQAKAAYLEAFENYSTNMGPYPWPEDYMTDEEYEEYVEAVQSYNEWYYGQENAIKEYVKIYAQVLRTSPSFNVNDMAMSPDGSVFLVTGTKETEDEDVMVSALYKFNTVQANFETMDVPGGFYPCQVFSNGMIFLTRGIQSMPTTIVLLPGSKEYIPFTEYIGQDFPEIAEYIESHFAGSGVVLGNEDMTFFSGALTPDLVNNYDWDDDNIDYYYSAYFISLPYAGVESILDEPNDGLYKVYNLSGMKVLETKDKEAVNALDKGIYIVNGKKVVIK